MRPTGVFDTSLINCASGRSHETSESRKAAARPAFRPESQETRERLLAVAQRLFAQHGYAGTSIRDLGSALGVASSSVLHHVGSKRKLYALVLSRISDSLSARPAISRLAKVRI